MSASHIAGAVFPSPPHNAQAEGGWLPELPEPGWGYKAVGPLLARSATFLVLFAHTRPLDANTAFVA